MVAALNAGLGGTPAWVGGGGKEAGAVGREVRGAGAAAGPIPGPIAPAASL